MTSKPVIHTMMSHLRSTPLPPTRPFGVIRTTWVKWTPTFGSRIARIYGSLGVTTQHPTSHLGVKPSNNHLVLDEFGHPLGEPISRMSAACRPRPCRDGAVRPNLDHTCVQWVDNYFFFPTSGIRPNDNYAIGQVEEFWPPSESSAGFVCFVLSLFTTIRSQLFERIDCGKIQNVKGFNGH